MDLRQLKYSSGSESRWLVMIFTVDGDGRCRTALSGYLAVGSGPVVAGRINERQYARRWKI